MSIPFKQDAYEGLAEVEGVVRFEADELIIEYRTIDAVFGVVKSDVDEVRVPLADLVSVELAKGLFSTKLRVRASSMRILEDCPGNRSGEVSLGIPRKHRDAASEFATDVSLRIGERRMDAASRAFDDAT